MPTFYGDAKMYNGSNGGGGPNQPIPQVVQPDYVEEAGTLVPQMAWTQLQPSQLNWSSQSNPPNYLTLPGSL